MPSTSSVSWWGEGVGSRCTANVTANVATNKTAAESETEELLRVREPVSEGGAKHGRFFGSDVSHPVAKGDVGVLIGVTTVGRAFEDGEGETKGVAMGNGCEEFAPDVAVGKPGPTERGEA